jgi:hypothetical protein
MKWFPLALPVALLAAWAVVSHGGPAAPKAPAETPPGVADADARAVLERFDRLRASLPGSGEPLRRLDEGRRLLGEALTLLDDAREQLGTEHKGKKPREQGALAPPERGRPITADRARPLADPPLGHPASRGSESLAVALGPNAGAAGKVTRLRLVIGNPEALSAPAGAYCWDRHIAAGAPAPAPSSASATMTATRAAPFPAAAPAAAGMAAGHANLRTAAEQEPDALLDRPANAAAPAAASSPGSATLAATRATPVPAAPAASGVTAGHAPPRGSVAQELDALLDRLAALESRLGSLPDPAGVSHSGPDVTIANPPPVPTADVTPTNPGALTFATPPQTIATPALRATRTAVERKFDTLLNLIRSMERHLDTLEDLRRSRSN